MTESRPQAPNSIQLATVADFTELQQLLQTANSYSIDRSGVPQWTAMAHVYGGLQEQLRQGHCFVIRDADGAITSTISLDETSDEWGERGHDGQALYFLKLMKDPVKAQQDEAHQFLAFTAAEAERRHKVLVRCDVVDEPAFGHLIDYYGKFGFVEVGKFTYGSSGRKGALLQAPVNTMLSRLSPEATA